MRVSHELTLSLLTQGFEINDYDYCLPHQLKYEAYANYFKIAASKGRFIILDNGLFENALLGTDDLIRVINKIQPTVFITPDEWNNRSITYTNALKWSTTWRKYISPQVELMGVIQASTLEEAALLYRQYVELGFKYISFNHSLQLYKQLFPSFHPLLAQTLGRAYLINYLKEKCIFNYTIYHHLLGCSLLQELAFYDEHSGINSIDTSNPITLAYEGKSYEKLGIYKPTVKIDDIFTQSHETVESLIYENTQTFKSHAYCSNH